MTRPLYSRNTNSFSLTVFIWMLNFFVFFLFATTVGHGGKLVAAAGRQRRMPAENWHWYDICVIIAWSKLATPSAYPYSEWYGQFYRHFYGRVNDGKMRNQDKQSSNIAAFYGYGRWTIRLLAATRARPAQNYFIWCHLYLFYSFSKCE